MTINFNPIGFSLNDEDRAFLEKKLSKLSFAEKYLMSVNITIKKETKGVTFNFSAILSFTWHKEKVVKTDSYELYDGVDKLVDMIQATTKKEKEKVMDI